MSIESERLDRMEQHLKSLKTDAENQNKTLDSIESALVGNIFNNHKGLTHIVHDIDIRVKRLEEDYTVTKENMRQLRIFAGVILTFIFGYILFLISR